MRHEGLSAHLPHLDHPPTLMMSLKAAARCDCDVTIWFFVWSWWFSVVSCPVWRPSRTAPWAGRSAARWRSLRWASYRWLFGPAAVFWSWWWNCVCADDPGVRGRVCEGGPGPGRDSAAWLVGGTPAGGAQRGDDGGPTSRAEDGCQSETQWSVWQWPQNQNQNQNHYRNCSCRQ